MEVIGIYCYNCKWFVYSRARHDFAACDCWNKNRKKAFAVDGGQSDYFKVSIGAESNHKILKIKIPEEENELINDWKTNNNKLGRIKIDNIETYSDIVK